jgi:hypothetical protein
MDERIPVPNRGRAVLGVLLVAIGVVGLTATWAGFDVDTWIGEHGWPIFVIVPGLLLWALAFVPRPPAGVGFAIAGRIVTSVGLLLWYQDTTDHWESWAYAWALIGPCAAGLGLLLYGLVTQTHQMVRQGVWIASIGFVVFVVGALFFESIFETGRVPFDLGDAWPVVLIGIGIVVIVASLLGPRSTGGHPGGQASGGAH